MKKIILSIIGLSVVGLVAGKSLSPAEALDRVETSEVRKAKRATAAPRLLDTRFDKNGTPAIYIFTYSGNEGFMLLSANDATQPLLGYSETNSFSMKDMPENINSWLTYYTDQIGSAVAEVAYRSYSTRAEERAPISPMLTTRWDQGRPYNLKCPYINGRQCVTGCVATAMAQVMNYWKYPLTGKGSVSYSPTTIDDVLSMDFAATTFEWDQMQDSYSYNSVNSNAVSTLMKACGYSVNMKYDVWQSGAYSQNIAPALINYFGYDKGLSQRDRSEYSSQDAWNDMIYNNMVTSGPVIYNGQSSDGAHCFVCDGYDGKGYFHINWGWGGISDGYFELNELTPSEIGTGGHYGGYNIYQSAVVGIMPPVGRLTLENISIDNAAEDSGNVKGWGYTYRINDFSNIALSVNLTISGGHISAPLYYTVYDTDPDTKKNKEVVLESAFDQLLNASDGKVTCATRVKLNNYDPSKLYTLNVSYDLKGQRTTIGSIRLAASSGVEDVFMPQGGFELRREGNLLKAEGESAVISLYDLSGSKVAEAYGHTGGLDLSGIAPGVYIATARTLSGEVKSLKLHLK